MKEKRITITGGKGFLGQHLARTFRERGYHKILVADLPDYNLIRPEDIRRLYDDSAPMSSSISPPRSGGSASTRKTPVPFSMITS